jgi:tol-pal system protein YbgF
MMNMRVRLDPAIGLAAALAGFACLAAPSAFAPAAAQVLGNGAYAPAPDPAIASLQNRMDALEADMRKATGRAEQLSFELTQAKKAAEDANAGRAEDQKTIAALTARLEALEQLAHGDTAAAAGVLSKPAEATVNLNAPVNAAAPAGAVDIASLPQDESGLFAQAKTFMLVPDYPSAQAAFQVFVKKYPKSDSIADAQYMLAEALLYQDNYADAAEAYGKVLKAYPKSSHAPEAVAKLARAMRLMGKKPEACKALSLLASNYPKAGEPAKTIAATEKSRSGC